MKKLQASKKITLATLKAFARRNEGNLLVKKESSFDGMTDMVEQSPNQSFEKTTIDLEKDGFYKTGIQGVYTVGSSRDWFTLYNDGKFIGVEVYNCCGTSILAVNI